jgi:hypothetical protein
MSTNIDEINHLNMLYADRIVLYYRMQWTVNSGLYGTGWWNASGNVFMSF